MIWLRYLVFSLYIVFISAAGLPKPPKLRINFAVGIEGMVFCQSCKLPGYNPGLNASPIPGANVIIRCRTNNTNTISLPVTTNNSGYFLLETSQLTSFTSNKCRVYVPKSPLRNCNVPLYPPRKGSNSLKFSKALKLKNGIEYLYSGGSFVFGPKMRTMCP
ncbi:hypothetical protein LUZ60_000488 [Juncus effusus]|nr:hypothetical protein LUZ60_000488 [Juncus effusus]